MPVYPINAGPRVAIQEVGRLEQTEGFARLHLHLFVPGSASIKVSWQGLTSFLRRMQIPTAVLAVPPIKNPITLIAAHRPWNIPCAHKFMTKLWPNARNLLAKRSKANELSC